MATEKAHWKVRANTRIPADLKEKIEALAAEIGATSSSLIAKWTKAGYEADCKRFSKRAKSKAA